MSIYNVYITATCIGPAASMRQQMHSSIKLLTQTADNPSRLYTETGDSVYLHYYEIITALKLDIKSRAMRRAADGEDSGLE